MLKKTQRLTTREFSSVMRDGLNYPSPNFVVKYLPAKELKISVSAPQKLYKTAVHRNQARRRLYSAIQDLFKMIKLKPNHIVIIPKIQIDGYNHLSLVKGVRGVFVQGHFLA